MKNNQLNRVLNLVRHTGDRVVVVDSENDDVLVVMHLSDYESLLKSKSAPYSSAHDYEEDDFPDTSLLDMSPTLQFEESKLPKNKQIRHHPSALRQVPRKSNFSAYPKDASTDFFGEDTLSKDEEWWDKEPKFDAHSEEKLDDIPEEEEKFYLEPVDEA